MGKQIIKVAVVCAYKLLPERIGGMDYFFWHFDQKCKENGIQVDWFFPNESSHDGYSELNIITSEQKNVEKFFYKYCVANKPNYTHVITHFVELCTPVFKKIKETTNAAIIAVDHNPRPIEGYPSKIRIKKKMKGILYSKYIDLFVGVSNYTVNEIVKDFGFHLKKKTIVIYNGVVIDNIIVNPQRKVLEPKFLVASHLRESKGIQDLIEAVHLSSNEIKDKLNIDIYGDGYYKEYLVKKVKEYRLEQIFIFKGSVPNLKEIYCQYDYMLQPTHMECFSLAILESLAANVPVITTSVGGNEEAITHGVNGFIVKPKDAFLLKSILQNVFLGNLKIAVDTRTFIENNFTIEKMVNNYIRLLQ